MSCQVVEADLITMFKRGLDRESIEIGKRKADKSDLHRLALKLSWIRWAKGTCMIP